MKFIGGIARRFSDWRAYKETVRELSALSNRDLNDLGINRTDIRTLARQHVDGLPL